MLLVAGLDNSDALAGQRAGEGRRLVGDYHMDVRPAAGAGERDLARLAAVGQDDDLAGLAHDGLLGEGLAGVGGGETFFQRKSDGPHEGLVQMEFLEDEARERTD